MPAPSLSFAPCPSLAVRGHLAAGRVVLASLLIAWASVTTGRARAEVLPIAPVVQQTPVWCWAAVSEMVFRHYDVPTVNPYGNYQCGIVAVAVGGYCQYDCGSPQCIVPAGTAENEIRVLEQYPSLAKQVTHAGTVGIDATPVYGPVDFGTLLAQIERGNPVVAGVNTDGMVTSYTAEHVTLIVGAEIVDGVPMVQVNDPFPYDYLGLPNPFRLHGAIDVAPGSYAMPYTSFVVGLTWSQSILVEPTSLSATPPPVPTYSAGAPGCSVAVAGAPVRDRALAGIVAVALLLARALGRRVARRLPERVTPSPTPGSHTHRETPRAHRNPTSL